jgi:putative ABC transport system substrate-binding protein
VAPRAQQGDKVHRIGLLTPTDGVGRRRALIEALQHRGYREGQNVAIEARSAEGRLEMLPDLARDLVSAGVDVIVAMNTPGVRSAIDTGTMIPIVMGLVGDPVGSGFVTSLRRPGGKVTGVSNAAGEIAAKRLALLKEALPHAKRIAVFTHPDNPVGAVQLRQVEASADALGVELKVFPVRETPDDMRRAVAETLSCGRTPCSVSWRRPVWD